MIDLALRDGDGPVTLAEISERQKISLSYLEQLFGKLRRGALVASTRGPGGGYRLAKPADAVSVADIIVAVDEPIDATSCGGMENCKDDGKCLTHDLWTALNERIFEYLRGVTLGQLVEQQRAAAATEGGPDVKVVELKDKRGSRRPEQEPAVSA
jgi:Rrf2 family iron-sulfur cluster assembly transcriptional regulator